jgi:ferredoxin
VREGVMKIEADRDVCIGAGMCVMTAEEVFDQDDDGIVVVLVDDVPHGEEDKAREAVKLCPSQALRIAD